MRRPVVQDGGAPLLTRLFPLPLDRSAAKTHAREFIILQKVKNKVLYLLQDFLHETHPRPEALLQSRKWELTGMS